MRRTAEPVENNKETTGKLRGGVTGKGFMPGQSGNPGGRPKGIVSAALTKELLKSGQLQSVVTAIVKKGKKGDVQAFNAIRDTVDGKPQSEPQDRGAQVIIQFIRDPQTPAIQVAVKPQI